MADLDQMDKLVSLCKRRGLIFPSSEVYGGLGSCWDYGPLGVELKRNVKEAWWRSIVREHPNITGLDSSILMHPEVWRASGHVESFTDPLTDCLGCHRRFRADQVEGGTCPECGGSLTPIRRFNLMFRTFLGPVEEDATTVYLRPETAQGIFVNFKNVQVASRLKVPFGIAQIGKAFRNEVTTGNFIFRTREFEQMELEFFVKPEEDRHWFQYWTTERFNWYLSHGIRQERIRLRPHAPEELAHYAKACVDIEYAFPFGWAEVEGIANRTDYDLQRHGQCSGRDLSYFDEETKDHYFPYVIEPSAGVDRSTLAFLVDAYGEEEDRVVLHLHPRLAPIQVGIFPLVNRDRLPERAMELERRLRPHVTVFYDDKGSIGRRYRRQDEIGTPWCVTVDSQTLVDDTVTLRDRDTMQQIRLPMEGLVPEITRLLQWPKPEECKPTPS